MRALNHHFCGSKTMGFVEQLLMAVAADAIRRARLSSSAQNLNHSPTTVGF